MANKTLFKSKSPLASLKPVDTVNEAGGKAYRMTDKHALVS